MKDAIKKLSKFITSRLLYLLLGLFLSATILTVHAAWDTTVGSGDTLTTTLWNDVVGKLVELDNRPGSAWSEPSDLKKTDSDHDGDFGGYKAMYDWIQANGCAGYHVCDATEVTRYAQINGGTSIPTYAWYNSGISPSNAIRDCTGWQDGSSTYQGTVWRTAYYAPNGFATFVSCANSDPVLCCK